MGCCACRPETDVLNDPSVTLRTMVGDVVFIGRYGNYMNRGLGVHGLMYVKDGMLCYDLLCFSRLCCRCCSRSYSVSDITDIEVVQNDIVMFARGDFIALQPGLKITIKSSESDSIKTVIAVAMPNAEQFASQLKQLTGSTTGTEFEKEFLM